MDKVLLEEKYILEYIRDVFHDIKRKNVFVDDARYHHNSSYSDATSICKYGILTMLDLKKFGIKEYTKETLKKMNDINSHINGNDGVSLSVVGLKDLYLDEDEYDPFTPTQVDFLVSSDIQASRTSIHYGNEFLSYKSIEVNKLKAVDIRLLRMLDLIEKRYSLRNYSIQSATKKYNELKNIATIIKQLKLHIPIREMSYQDGFSIDIDKLSDIPKLLIKESA